MLWIRSLFLFLCLQAISGTLLEELDVEVYSSSGDLNTTTSEPVDKCAPDCTGVDNAEKVENPKDCHQFYVCSGGNPIGPIDCPDGQHFETAASDCVTDGPEECVPSCGGPGGKCNYECSATGSLRADRYDCSTYYICNGESDLEIECGPDAPFFDGETCQTEEKKCCHCNPYCYAGDKQVMDPTDCTRFYYCIEPPEIPVYSSHCTDGNFDPFTQECSSTIPCLTLCTNHVKPDGCIDRFTCQEYGYFAMCVDKCVPQYYTCLTTDIGHVVEPDTCAGTYVFDPTLRTCVVPSVCSFE